MFYIPELLCRRNRGRLSRCWFAAILSENDFKRMCKTNDLINLNIELASEEIMNVINSTPGTSLRFSLYLSSQLMFGLTKIQLYKTTALEAHTKNLQTALRPIDLKKLQKKKEKLEAILDLPLNLPDPNDLVEKFSKHLNSPDRHLLEPDYYDASFSNIQDDEFEEREFDIPSSNDLAARLREFLPNETEVTDRSREHLIVDNTDLNNLPHGSKISEVTRQPLTDLNAMNLPDGNNSRTPSKRKGRAIDANTPSKRHRKTLFGSLENQENISPTNIPNEDQSYNLRENMENDPPVLYLDASNIQSFGQNKTLIDNVPNPDVPAEPPLEASSSKMDSNLSLEPLILSEILPRRKRKPGKLIIDQINRIPASEMQPQTHNINIMTRPHDIVNIDRIRFDSQLLFTKPSTSRRGRSIIDCSNKLQSLFKLNIKHQFHVDYDESLFPEKIRYRETSENAVELSSGDSRRQQQINELSAKDISDPSASADRIIPHGEIDNELFNDIEDTRIILEPTIYSEFATVGDDTNLITTDDTVRVRDSTKSNTDFSSFLPEHHDRSSVHKQSSSEPEKIIDIRSKSRSESPVLHERLIEEIYIQLERRWSEKDGPINFENLFVPAKIQEFDVACNLLYLLHLAKNGRIDLKQSEPYEIIWIYLR